MFLVEDLFRRNAVQRIVFHSEQRTRLINFPSVSLETTPLSLALPFSFKKSW